MSKPISQSEELKELVRDTIGAAVADSSEIGATVNDTSNTIAFSVKEAAISEAKLSVGVQDKLNTVASGASSFVGSFAEGSLPTDAAFGSKAYRSNKQRGEMRLTASAKWIPVDGLNQINLLDFCHPAVVTDCTAGIQAAINYLNSIGGGTILLPNGYTFAFSSTLDLSNTVNIRFLGSNQFGQDNGTANLLFTGGAGIDKAIDCKASFGFTMEYVKFVYDNPAFDGELIRFNQGVGGAVPLFPNFRSNYLGGNRVTGAKNARSILNLSTCLIGTIQNNSFFYAEEGIRGGEKARAVDRFTPVTTGLETYLMTIDEQNTFNFIRRCIMNYGSNWTIRDNTFEPFSEVIEDNFLIALDKDLIDTPSKALIFTGNWLGDANRGSTMVNLDYVIGGDISSNWFTVPATAKAIRVAGSYAVGINYNRMEPSEGALIGDESYSSIGVWLDTNASQNYGVEITYNSFQVATPYVHNGVSSYSFKAHGNERGGEMLVNFQSGGQIIEGSNGTDRQATSIKGITFGTITGNAATVTAAESPAAGAAIRIANAYSAALDGAMIFDIRNEVLSEFIFRNGGEQYLRLNNNRITLGRNLAFLTDNARDIGEAADYRPRTGYFATSVVTPSINLGGTILNNSTVALKSEVAAAATKAADVRSATGTTDTLVVADLGKDVRYTSASAKVVTLPPTSGFDTNFICAVTNLGAGALTFAAGSGVTIRNNSGALAQYKTASVRRIGTDEYLLTGELS